MQASPRKMRVTAMRIGDKFDLDVNGTTTHGVIKGLFGLNDRSERLWLVEIDGVDSGWPVPERALIHRGSSFQRHRRSIEIADE